MIVKIIKNYRDTKLNKVVVPCSTEDIKILVDVSDERAKELIDAKVGEKYNFQISKPKTKTDETKENKNKDK